MLKSRSPGCCSCSSGCTYLVTIRGCGNKPLPSSVTCTLNLIQGGSTIYTGTTTGSAYTFPSVAAGSYTLQITETSGRFATYSQPVTIACPNTGTTATLSPASGYICTTVCALPLPSTLHATVAYSGSDGILGGSASVSFSYSSTDGGWVGSTTKTVDILPSCSFHPGCGTSTGSSTLYMRLQQNPAGGAFLLDALYQTCATGSQCTGYPIADAGGHPPASWSSIPNGYAGDLGLADQNSPTHCPLSFAASFIDASPRPLVMNASLTE